MLDYFISGTLQHESPIKVSFWEFNKIKSTTKGNLCLALKIIDGAENYKYIDKSSCLMHNTFLEYSVLKLETNAIQIFDYRYWYAVKSSCRILPGSESRI